MPHDLSPSSRFQAFPSATTQVWGGALALVGLVAIALSGFSDPFLPSLAVMAGLVLALRQDRFQADLDLCSYRRVRGWLPLPRTVRGGFEDFARVAVRSVARTGSNGGRATTYSLVWLEWKGGMPPIKLDTFVDAACYDAAGRPVYTRRNGEGLPRGREAALARAAAYRLRFGLPEPDPEAEPLTPPILSEPPSKAIQAFGIGCLALWTVAAVAMVATGDVMMVPRFLQGAAAPPIGFLVLWNAIGLLLVGGGLFMMTIVRRQGD